MSQANTGYPALDAAINQAAATYNVPADLLAGIWRIESGSTYPNPAVNSSGYGGLFGTTQPYATTQVQANLAASILHNGLVQAKGNVSQALSYYNSGKLSGGYTSVPGQTTTGRVGGYGGGPASAVFPGGPAYPSGSGLGKTIGSGANAVTGGATSVYDAAVAVPKFLGKITDTSNILRALQVIAGGALVGVGLVLLVRQVALAADLPDPLEAVASRGTSLAKTPAPE